MARSHALEKICYRHSIDFHHLYFCTHSSKLDIKKRSAVAEMSDRGQNRHGPKRGGLLCPFCRWGTGSHPAQFGLGRGLLPYQVVSSSIQPFGHNRHGPKTGGCASFRGWELRPHDLTQRCLGQGSIPSGIFIHPAIWPH